MNPISNKHELKRDLNLVQATAINMIDMVGIGPFITMSLIVGLMQGPMSILAWILGALLAYMDGFVWSELGAAYPEAGGSYVFLQRLYKGKFGKLISFLFIWQTTIQAPLVVASGSIGFSKYLTFLVPLSPIAQKIVSGSLVLFLVLLLYRGIKSIGKISIFLWFITGGTILWIIISGLPHANWHQSLDFEWKNISWNSAFFVALGQSSLKSVYSYLGYYNVCHLGAEIKEPSKNIPRSIFISISGIAILYLLMQTTILGVLPWHQVAESDFVVSVYFEHLYSHTVGQFATVLVLCLAVASLFSVMLGYSRVPYAAALNGDFFPVFAKVHSQHQFPNVSLLVLGSVAFVFSLLFKMADVITAIITMRILIQFIAQALGVIGWRLRKNEVSRPFKMPLFPLPALISIIIWLFIFFSSPLFYIELAFVIIITGILMFFVKQKIQKK